MWYKFEDEFVVNNEEAEDLINENFYRFPKVESGIWILTTHEWRYVFRKLKNEFDVREAIDNLLEYDNETLSHIWIDSRCFKISKVIEKFVMLFETLKDFT